MIWHRTVQSTPTLFSYFVCRSHFRMHDFVYEIIRGWYPRTPLGGWGEAHPSTAASTAFGRTRGLRPRCSDPRISGSGRSQSGNSIRDCIACHWRCSGGSSAGAMLHALQLKPYPIFSNGAEHCPVPSWRLCDFGAVYKCHESYDQDDLLTFIGRNVVPVA